MAHFYPMKDYELIEHTADIGVRVKGKSLKDLFKNAAMAIFEIMAEEKLDTPSTTLGAGKTPLLDYAWGRQDTRSITIRQKADNLEELFVNWLNELLSLSATKELIFSDFQIDKLDENILEAEAIGEDIKNYKINTEIKAATYHELKIKKINSGWQAEIIFDV